MPLKYDSPGICDASIIIAHNVPNIPPNINDVTNIIPLEQPLLVDQNKSAIISIGNMINVGIF
jgi:hypothetical protein